MNFRFVSPWWAACSGGLPFLFLAGSSVSADVTTTLYTSLTHTNNLEVQDGNGVESGGQNNLNRSGFETGISILQQSLDYQGGYVVQANAALNRDLSGKDDITRVNVSASRLSALSPDWLLRNRFSARWYDNPAIPSNS